jgi:aminomethyltransferase
VAESKSDLIKTAFHEHHVKAGAKMVPFAGFHMPVQYEGITAEHLAVRENVGLFDLSHMGEFDVTGNDALAFLQKVTTNDVAALEPGQIQYSCMTLEHGGIVDDLLIYRLPKGYMLVVNASNLDKDLAWLQKHLSGEVSLVDRSAETSLLAIQGPQAQKLLQPLTNFDLESMPYYTSTTAAVAGCEILFSRTGYTGEDGFELYIPREHTDSLWHAINEAGITFDLKLIGLGARDSLRLEMKMGLYGNEIDETTNPIEAGLGWIVKLDKEFIGRDAVSAMKESKPPRRLVCLELEGRAIPRQGYDVIENGEAIGQVTSGAFSPSLQKPIAMAYVPRLKAKIGTKLVVAIRNKEFPAVVVKQPFYKKASHR